MEVMYWQVAGIDVHKKQVTVTVRTTAADGQRRQQTRRFHTFYSSLQEMAAWLREQGVTKVAMEATGVYWKPVFHALTETDDDLGVLLCNAHHVKNVPGHKTDVSDSAWLAELCEVGLLRGSFIPPAQIAAIRELVRYRKKLIEERSRETQRLHKVLEDGGIKLASVASDSLGKSGRAMIEALIAGERDPAILADLALGVLRNKIPDLTLALAGRFGDHHALLARLHLDHIDHLTNMIKRLDNQIEESTSPFRDQLRLLRTIPGIGQRVAETVIAEIGVDMSRFPTAAHLASWVGLCPANNESAGKRKRGASRHGNTHLCTVLVEAAWSASRTRTYLGARFHRFHRKFGSDGATKAALATAHALIVIIWNILTTNTPYKDLGHDYYDRRPTTNPADHHKRQLEALGYTVTLTPHTTAA